MPTKRSIARRRQISSNSESDHTPVAAAKAAPSPNRLEDDQDALAAALQDLSSADEAEFESPKSPEPSSLLDSEGLLSSSAAPITAAPAATTDATVAAHDSASAAEVDENRPNKAEPDRTTDHVADIRLSSSDDLDPSLGPLSERDVQEIVNLSAEWHDKAEAAEKSLIPSRNNSASLWSKAACW
jgi:hypothetical protein